MSIETNPLGGAGGAGVYNNPLYDAQSSQSTETVNKVVAKVVDGIVTKSRVSTDSKVTEAIANSLALSMGLAAAKLMSPADLALMLKTAQAKVEQSMLSLSKNDIERIQKEQKAQAEVRLAKLEEQIENATKAQKSGLIGKIFGWIAAAFMAIAGALLIATGVAAGAGAALLVGGIAMMTAMALQTPDSNGVSPMDKILTGLTDLLAASGVLTKEEARGLATGIVAALFIAATAPAFIFAGPAGGIAVLGSLLPLLVTPDNLVKMGMKDEEAQKLSLGLTIGMAVAAIAVTAGPALASVMSSAAARLSVMVSGMSDDLAAFLTRAASRGAQFADAAENFLGPATKIADRVSNALANKLQVIFKATAEQMELTGKIGGYGAQIAQATSMVGTGVAGAVGTHYTLESTEAKAEAKLLEAFLANLANKFQEEKDRLDEIVRKLMNFEPIVAMMESTFEAASFVERHS